MSNRVWVIGVSPRRQHVVTRILPGATKIRRRGGVYATSTAKLPADDDLSPYDLVPPSVSTYVQIDR